MVVASPPARAEDIDPEALAIARKLIVANHAAENAQRGLDSMARNLFTIYSKNQGPSW